MRAFFITNFEHSESYSIGNRHVARTNDYGNFKAELFEAVKGVEGFEVLKQHGISFLKRELWTEEFHKLIRKQHYDTRPGIVGCFASHYQLWIKCVELNEPIGIFEYDAKQVRAMCKNYDFENILYLSAWRNMNGDPEKYHEFRNSPTEQGIEPYVGYDRWGFKNCMSGTHAYLVKPHAAEVLIKTAKEIGWFPVDRFFSTDIVSLTKQTITPAYFKVSDSKNLSFHYVTP